MNTPASPLRSIDPARLKSWLGDGQELALLDVREHGQYGEGHLFFGVNVPFSRLEIEAPRLVPNPGVRVVLYDDGDGVGDRARAVMETMGYTDIHVLKGGAPAWREVGFRLFAGVNLPSKTFGELAEHVLGTPRIAAADLAERLERGDDLRVVDGRTFAEFRKMSIPGATSCPNGELALRIDDLVGDPRTTIVVNCAGRTRSIIGAQTLIDLGLPNPVLALENGTQGWFLADLPLEHGATRRHAMTLEDGAMQARRRRALDRAARTGVRLIEAAEAQAWLADPARTTYLCDVRTPEEFAAGSLPGAQHCPGGQLIQATDLYVGVQNARMVLFDAELVRAPVVAAWLVQMGWEVAVLTGGLDAGLRDDLGGHLDRGRAERALPPIPAALDLSQLIEGRGEGRVLLDIRPGQSFRAGHVEDAIWSIRPALGTLRLTPGDPVILIADSLEMGALAARTLRELGVPVQGVHTGSPEDWRRAGLPVAVTPGDPSDRACIDYLFFVHDRHDGNKEAARQYLAWETDLIHRIDAQERARFTFHAPPPTGEF